MNERWYERMKNKREEVNKRIHVSVTREGRWNKLVNNERKKLDIFSQGLTKHRASQLQRKKNKFFVTVSDLHLLFNFNIIPVGLHT
jgi:hypothetical protein